jgi:hypothetical protein
VNYSGGAAAGCELRQAETDRAQNALNASAGWVTPAVWRPEDGWVSTPPHTKTARDGARSAATGRFMVVFSAAGCSAALKKGAVFKRQSPFD